MTITAPLVTPVRRNRVRKSTVRTKQAARPMKPKYKRLWTAAAILATHALLVQADITPTATDVRPVPMPWRTVCSAVRRPLVRNAPTDTSFPAGNASLRNAKRRGIRPTGTKTWERPSPIVLQKRNGI